MYFPKKSVRLDQDNLLLVHWMSFGISTGKTFKLRMLYNIIYIAKMTLILVV